MDMNWRLLILVRVLFCSTILLSQDYKLHSMDSTVHYLVNSQQWKRVIINRTLLKNESILRSSGPFSVSSNSNSYPCPPTTGERLYKLIEKSYTPKTIAHPNAISKGMLLPIADDESANDQLEEVSNIRYIGIGIHHYNDTCWHPLPDPSSDLINIRNAIRDYMAPSNNYRFCDYKLISGKSNTITDTIHSAFNSFADSIRPNSPEIVIVYISGHGQKDNKGSFHLITTDSHFDQDNNCITNSITEDELKGFISKLANKNAKVLVFIDACYSGAIELPDMDSGKVVCFMSTSEKLKSYDNVTGSPFAKALISCLYSDVNAQVFFAGCNDGNIVTPLALSKYIDSYVDLRQKPTFKSIGLSEDTEKLWSVRMRSKKVDQLTDKINSGDINALIELGDLYYYGSPKKEIAITRERELLLGFKTIKFSIPQSDTIIQNYRRAFELYTNAYEKGSKMAGCKLGICYFYGNDYIRKNINRAYEYFLEASEANIDLSNYYLSVIYQKGLINGKNDSEKAKQYFKKIKKYSKDILEAFYIERTAFPIKNKNNIVYDEKDNIVKETNKVGMHLGYYKNIEKQSPDEYLLITILNAIFGSKSALNNWGVISLKGLYNVQVDTEWAFSCFKQVAERKYKLGMYNLAICYLCGFGTDKNPKEAMRLLNVLSNKGFTLADVLISNCYINGDFGIEKNENLAISHLLKAAKKGNETAQFNLYQCFRNGIGVEKNSEKAFKWLELSAKNNNSIAQYELGKCYFYGELVEIDNTPNQSIAKKWFEKAKENENEDAKVFLENNWFERTGEQKREW